MKAKFKGKNASAKTKAAAKKVTGNQCRDTATKFWKWIGRLEKPAVAILPVDKERNDEWNEDNMIVLGYEELGRIKVVGTNVVTEKLHRHQNSTPSYLIFKFDSVKDAQGFAKRLRGGGHQIVIPGEDCMRVTMVSANPKYQNASDCKNAEAIVEAVSNVVSFIGQEMTRREVIFNELLPIGSFDSLIDRLDRAQHSGPLIC